MDSDPKYKAASIQTTQDLRTVATMPEVATVSQLSLPEIEAIAEMVSRVVPAGNVPGVILSGLARLPGRQVPLSTVRRDIRLLFRGVEQTLDHALYAALFAGPAAVLWGYQNLLKLAGKPPEGAFPEGTWQFYVDYALREDTARHTNETHGFDTALEQHGIPLSATDRLTAWALAAANILYQYDELIENEWRERVYTALLETVAAEYFATEEAAQFQRLHRAWQQQLPYRRGPDAARQTYPQYRRTCFDTYIQSFLTRWPPAPVSEWHRRVQAAEIEELPAYLQQMSILAYLEPDRYSENRVSFSFSEAVIGLILNGRYYLLPASDPTTHRPLAPAEMRSLISTLVQKAGKPRPVDQGLESALPTTPQSLIPLAETRRSALADLRGTLSQELRSDLGPLQNMPILIQGDRRPQSLSLAQLRQAERGLGDHPLTIFDTGKTFVFDQSHIFFDGAWGAALAEIMTNEALSWAVYLNNNSAPADDLSQITAPEPSHPTPIDKLTEPLEFRFKASDRVVLAAAPHRTIEAGAENRNLNLAAMQGLRRLLVQRNALLCLTVNDLLVLYRAIHAFTYQLSPELLSELENLKNDPATRFAAAETLAAIHQRSTTNPSLLIPVGANLRKPQNRLCPLSIEVPLVEMDLLSLHSKTVIALEAYQDTRRRVGRGELLSEIRAATVEPEAKAYTAPRDLGPMEAHLANAFNQFDELQRTYLATLAGYGMLFSRAKAIALEGETTSAGVIKLLAHLPVQIQRLLDRLPATFDLLNDILKGREVFSNIGAVAPTSTLTRFLSAKDDNEKKSLIWGIMTDSEGVTCLTLRDFSPHVAVLAKVGQQDLAHRLTQDYLDSYVTGLNRYIADLRRITIASRKTQAKPIPHDGSDLQDRTASEDAR